MESKKFTGKGSFSFDDKREYVGEWYEGKQHGKGIMRFSNYDEYDGEWNEGEMQGTGIYRFWDMKADKFTESYCGEFVAGKRCGIGVMEYSNGDVYNGTWQNDKRTGEGYCVFPNGDCFHGLWRENNMIRGVYSLANGDKYDGGISNGVFSGFGKYYWKDSIQWFEGEWINGKIKKGLMFDNKGCFSEYLDGKMQ